MPKPLFDRVIIKRSEAEEFTPGGIALPAAAKEKPKKGVVVAVGDGNFSEDGSRRQMQVRVGDWVLFNAYSGNEIHVDGDVFLIMSEGEIMAVVDKEEGEEWKGEPSA